MMQPVEPPNRLSQLAEANLGGAERYVFAQTRPPEIKAAASFRLGGVSADTPDRTWRFAHSERRSTPFLRCSIAGNRIDLRGTRLRPLLYSRGKHDSRLAVVCRDGSPRLYL